MGEFEQWLKSLNENGRVTYFLGQEGKVAKEAWDFQQSKIEQLEKQQRINSECINNLVKQKADYLYKVTKAIAHLDSFDHSRAGMNQLVRSIESALEALRGES